MKMRPGKKGRTRLPLILAGIFFMGWVVAVIFAVGETFSRPHENSEASNAAMPAGLGEGGSRYPILDRNRRELAVSFPMKSVYARPLEVEDPEAAVRFLAPTLGLDEKRLQREFREERGFFWLGRQLPEKTGRKLGTARLPGVYVVDESQRYYPQKAVAAHVVGFVGEGHGLAGIEAQYDRQLRGLAEPLEPESGTEARGPLVLTLDLRVQELLEKQLSQLVAATGATGGGGLVLEARSGEILGMASHPTYDPNHFWEYDENGRTNRVTASAVPAAGFLNLFRLAAFYRQASATGPESTGNSASLQALKAELMMARVLDKMGERQERLVRQGERFLSPALASLAEVEEAGALDVVGQELAREGQPLSGSGPGKMGARGDSPTATGIELLSGLATLLTPNGSGRPHLLAGVLDGSTGQVKGCATPAEPVVSQAGVEKMRDYFRGLPKERGGVTILEELTPVPSTGQPEAIPAGGREGEEERPAFASLLVALLGGEKSPNLLLLLELEEARLDPALRSPMSLAAEKILPRSRDWAAEAQLAPAWQPREDKWRSEWQSLQLVRGAKSQESPGGERRQMPDLQGLSLRKALQVLNRYDLKIRVQGSGLVAGQKPGPGAVIAGDQCLLVLAGRK